MHGVNNMYVCMYVCVHTIEFSKLCLALSPGPFPAFQCCTLKSGKVLYAKSHAACHDDRK